MTKGIMTTGAILMDLKYLLGVPSQILGLHEVTIRISGDPNSKSTFHELTKPHPKYKFIQNKRWGAGLLLLPERFDDYLKGKDKQALRTNRRRSTEYGFRFDKFAPSEHLEAILAINTSTRVHQGYRMSSAFLNIGSLRNWTEDKPTIYGLFDPHESLKAYAHVRHCGEVAIFSSLLGHAEDLDKGIMYLLVSEVIREMIEHKCRQGIPIWAMYDTFFGASPGLRYFKERLGFKPYKVRWIWEA
jgi:hypothetical protein